jgi:hypothetical protein
MLRASPSMLPTHLLAAAVAALALTWLGLAVSVVGSRMHSERRRRRCDADADALASGRLAAQSLGSRRLLRLAEGEFGVASSRAAHELVRRDCASLLRSARQRGSRSLTALRVLARGGSPAVYGALRAARACSRPEVTAGVVGIVAELETGLADRLLLELLVSGDYPRSRTATELAPRASRLVDELLGLVPHAEPAVRYWALMLLRDANPGRRITDAAVAAATDAEPLVRGAASRLLGESGQPGQLPVLRSLLADDVFFVRAHAARSVGKLGARSLAAEVAALLADESWWTRAAAKESLLCLGQAGLDAARRMAGDSDRFARDGAAEVIDAFRRMPSLYDPLALVLAEGAA